MYISKSGMNFKRGLLISLNVPSAAFLGMISLAFHPIQIA